MARKKKELPTLEGIEITAVAAEGNSIARVNDLVVFIPYGAPGDIVNVKLDRKKHSYAEGHITSFIHESEKRAQPQCEHYGLCGGCRWQHLPYEEQIKWKQRQVSDALTRIAKVDLPEIKPTLASDNIYGYRNKMEYTFSNKKWLTREQLESGVEFTTRDTAGFHIPGAFDKVLEINKCLLQEDLGNRVRNFVRQLGLENHLSFYDLRNNEGLLRTMMIRTLTTGENMVVMSFGQNDHEKITFVMERIKDEFPELTSLMYVVNLKANDTIGDLDIILYSGREYIEEEMEGLKFRIGPKSFYQTNSHQAYKLYSVARDMAGLKGDELVYDLYTGTGTIANFIARKARHVIGIEYVKEAIDDARINSAVNNISNTEFYAGDMKDVLTDEFIAEHGRPDVMIVDPPRAGMHGDVVDVILNAEPRVIVYVSCNPATQARDLALLDVKYKVEAVQPVDMFPHTHHVENVVKLTLKRE
ncbi:MAG: 23S rRNA (uracil(1939)-C(5))-methyltransferase RlmD [Clostridiales bacterium]|nr:23S rRNA (uracil(1939)-C(5))-methyltransferase RlmD [Clostridiales bacterium]